MSEFNIVPLAAASNETRNEMKIMCSKQDIMS